MYNDKVILDKTEFIPPIPDSMIPVDCCKTFTLHYFTINDMTSNFELFSKEKKNNIYLTEIMRSDWLHMLDY